MIAVLTIVANSWPIAVMVIGLATAYVVRRSLRQAMSNSDEVRSLRASNAMTVRERKDY